MLFAGLYLVHLKPSLGVEKSERELDVYKIANFNYTNFKQQTSVIGLKLKMAARLDDPKVLRSFLQHFILNKCLCLSEVTLNAKINVYSSSLKDNCYSPTWLFLHGLTQQIEWRYRGIAKNFDAVFSGVVSSGTKLDAFSKSLDSLYRYMLKKRRTSVKIINNRFYRDLQRHYTIVDLKNKIFLKTKKKLKVIGEKHFFRTVFTNAKF